MFRERGELDRQPCTYSRIFVVSRVPFITLPFFEFIKFTTGYS